MYQITKEKFIENVKKYCPNDDFTILEFTNAKSPVTIQCNKCKQIMHYNRGTSIYKKDRKYLCRLCNSKSVIELRQACEEQNITIVETTAHVTDKWKLHCNRCGTDFEREPSNWLKKSCPVCGMNHNCYDKQTRQKMVDEKFGIGEFEVLSDGAATRHFTIRHKCGFIRNTQFMAFMTSKGCPRCNNTMSRGERKILLYLENNNINFIPQKKMGLTKQTLDFFLPELNMAIEYNGEQHYKPIEIFGGEERFNQQQEYDRNKIEYCKQNGIKLLIISYLDFNNIDTILDANLKSSTTSHLT